MVLVEYLLTKGRRACFMFPAKRFFRRCQDIVVALTCLALLWPVMLVTAALILLESPGASPIFAQTRIGKNGKPFTLYKFRSMHPGAEAQLKSLLPQNEMQGPVFKIRSDPRITKVGHFLRRYSVDELPQLWNVLRGDMSIVGPRPALPREVELYDPRAWQRLRIKPGLTCFWQVQPNRNSLSFDQWLELDLKYLRKQSFLADWKIMVQTLGAVVRGDGM